MRKSFETGSVSMYLLVFLVIGGLLALVISLSYQNSQLRKQSEQTLQTVLPTLSPTPVELWALPNQHVTKADDRALSFPSAVPTGKISLRVIKDGCVIGGCSKELCQDPNAKSKSVGICVYLEEYACYETAICEKQKDGACGWTQNDSLKKCFDDKAQNKKNFPQ
ncbi:MAG: hypothetical protein WCO06_02050 [Candidatus Roizmanbacteria bacterium]